MMLSDDHLRHLVPMPPSPCGCAPRPWPRPVVPVPVTPQMQPRWAEELRRILDGKQDAIADLDEIREGAQAGAAAYQKPEDGVPKTDLSEDVQASLDKADSAYQKPEGGIPKTDLSEAVQASLDNADTAVQPDDILSGGKVKSDLLPSYVDDVIEVANYAALPATGESGKIYVTLDTNRTYRWSGTQYTEIANPDLDDAVTPTSANGVKSSGIWSAIWGTATTAFTSLYDWCVSQLAGKASTADATLTQNYTDWVCSPAETQGEEPEPYFVRWDTIPGTEIETETWCLFRGYPEIDPHFVNAVDPTTPNLRDITSATFTDAYGETVTITRTASSYRLGPDSEGNPNRDKPLASEAEAEALRQGKLDKSGGEMTGEIRWGDQEGVAIEGSPEYHSVAITDYYGENIVYIKPTNKTSGAPLTSLKDIAPAYNISTAYVVGQLCIKDDALVKCTTAGTGNAAVFADATVEDVLAALRTALAGKFAQYYPDGSVKSTTEFTQGIKYNAPDTVNRTITVKPFCNTGDSENDNSGLVGRVVIPPFVDEDGNGYISDDGTRFKVVGVSSGSSVYPNNNLTAIIAPNTLTTIRSGAFAYCISLTTVSLPAATTIRGGAFDNCTSLTSVSLPAATTIEPYAFAYCTSLTSVSLPAATTIGDNVFDNCTALTSVDFGDTPRLTVPTLGGDAFYDVPNTCTIIVPYTQYDAWKAADGWKDLTQEFVRHAEKADKPATFTTGNLAAIDADGNPTDSTIPAANVAVKGEIPYTLVTKTITNGAVSLDNRASNAVTISTTLSPNTLTVNFPTATSGKVRDFAMRLNIAAGVTAPEIAWPQGVTLENNGGEVPEIADGGTGGSSTILYFSETENNGTTAKFLVKGETLTAIAQA